jgi:hypothetical protein
MSQLATPSGIDHDYNFLHSIETRIERSEKVLIEDLGIVSSAELKRARAGEDEALWKQRHGGPEAPGEAQIARVLQAYNISVLKAPKGMRRNRENTTNWHKKHKEINWQVEWVREPPLERTLYSAPGSRPIGEVYDILCEEERRMNMTEEERKVEKRAQNKRKAEAKLRSAKKRKLGTEVEMDVMDLTTTPLLQNPQTTAWDVPMEHDSAGGEVQEEVAPTKPKHRDYSLYLLRPGTPASFPKVLALLDPNKSLSELLRNREVLEFPTIHVLSSKPQNLPKPFMSENSYLAAIGQGENVDTDSSDETGNSDDTSSSDSNGDSSEDDSDAGDGETM